MAHRIFTSESVTEGHPDKVCDQISDAVLDAILAQDPYGRVACETVTTTGLVMVMGEISTSCYVDIPGIVRRTVDKIGYNDPAYGFDAQSCAVMTTIDEQSRDIAMGVDGESDEDIGAGDQGMMFGYACDETPELMPAPIAMAHALCRRLAAARKSGELGWLRPDGKSQVTVEYDAQGNVLRCPAIVVSTQHSPEISTQALREAVIETVVKPVIPAEAGQTICVVGASGFGQPIVQAAHRPERYAALAGVPETAEATPETEAAVLRAEALHTRIYVNQVETLWELADAKALAALLECPVLAGSLQRGEYFSC